MTTALRQRQLITPDKNVLRQMTRYMAAIVLIAILSGCAIFAKAPMEVLTYENPNKEATHRQLIVFLRPLGGDHSSFEKEGLVADVWAHDLPFDVAAPNAHLGYYTLRNLIPRLKEDVIDPARARGCKKIWLVGVSMGGLGSMLYFKEHPEDIAGVYLISPYLGSQLFFAEMEAAGGVRQWKPPLLYNADIDWHRMLWDWMKTTIADNPDKIVYMGYGSNDPYKSGQQFLAELLPPGRVYITEGAHDMKTLKALWKIFLDSDTPLRN